MNPGKLCDESSGDELPSVFETYPVKSEPNESQKENNWTDKRYEKAEVILNILLNSPEELNLKAKPSAIRDDKVFTLNAAEISIQSASADGNGIYLANGVNKKLYVYNKDICRVVHRGENREWFIQVKDGKSSYCRKTVEEKDIVELTRRYQVNKNNRKFSRIFVTVRKFIHKDPETFYLMMYRWTEGADKVFYTTRHGNSQRPSSGPYTKKDPSLVEKVDTLLDEGHSVDKVYNSLTRITSGSAGETIPNPKFIGNRKYNHHRESATCTEIDKTSEVEALIYKVKADNSMINAVIFSPRDYVIFNYQPIMMHNIRKFCVTGDSILRVDTTFELVDGLWLTDTTYTNEALIKVTDGKHPEFPGPSMWHFRKDRAAYRRFAAEIVMVEPELVGIKKIGHDLDRAIPNGITDIIQNAKKFWCIQHIQEIDVIKLKKLGTSQNGQTRIMADIYGTQQDVFFDAGLADAHDTEDFDIKLESLKEVWNTLAPGFHSWFKSKRSEIFRETVIMSAREVLGIEGRFYTKGLELKHKLQKKKLDEANIQKEVSAVTEVLQEWCDEFTREEVRAIQGLGKYRLAPGYDHLFVDPSEWRKWVIEKKSDWVKQFRDLKPPSYNCYKNPKSAGLKSTPPSKKRRAMLPEAELFDDHFKVYPKRLRAGATSLEVTASYLHDKQNHQNNAWDVSLWDPDRDMEKV